MAVSISKHLLVIGIKCYQSVFSPFLGCRCRFFPSCSHYALACLQKYSLPRALLKIFWRLSRCQPLSEGGVDQP